MDLRFCTAMAHWTNKPGRFLLAVPACGHRADRLFGYLVQSLLVVAGAGIHVGGGRLRALDVQRAGASVVQVSSGSEAALLWLLRRPC
jgi:hypothetical protein